MSSIMLPTNIVERLHSLEQKVLSGIDCLNDINYVFHNTKNPIYQRYCKHLLIKSHLYKRDLNSCLSEIKLAEESYPQYIGIKADKACVYYISQDYVKWSATISDLETSLLKVRKLISEASYIKTKVLIGKFKEEQGDVTKALQIYNSLHKSLDKVHDDYPMLLAQLLRLKSQWSINKDLEKSYYELFTLNKEKYHNNFQIEVTHALFIAEIELFGLETATNLYLKFHPLLNKYDQNLFLIDMLEICMRKSWAFPEKLAGFINRDSLNRFEECLLNIHENKYTTDVYQQEELPPHGKLLLMLHFLLKSPNHSSEMLKRFNFLLQSFNEKNQNLWLNRLKAKSMVFPKNKLTIDLEKKSLYFQGGSYCFAKRKVISKILYALAEKPEIHLKDLTPIVWSCEYNDSFYNRVRMALKRFNKEVALEYTCTSLIQLKGEHVSLNPSVSATYTLGKPS